MSEIRKLQKFQNHSDEIFTFVQQFGRASEKVYKDGVCQAISLNEQSGCVVMSTVHGSAGTQHIRVTWLLNLLSKTTPNSVDKAMVDEDDDIESVRSDIPYNVGSHLKSTANTAVA
ncbi:hypothetical protein N7530_008035 [Penicillium desertorum]|uniref:Uncharacterized protein n=1 Tax=Penicillium desertorum TaxID=1303715 RepID=A0A9X0BKS7_9EURO|nr:hypothetical protein N7530_008035 [Penicillium desertorum]